MARTEAVTVRALAESPLLFEVGTDVLDFELDLGVRGLKGSQAAERCNSSLVTALLDQETGRLKTQFKHYKALKQCAKVTHLRKPHHADSKDESPDELNTGRDTP